MSTREALIAAALVELDECGHAGVSLRAVARRAGVSHAAPKNHFGDRAGLLTAVATRGFTELADELDAVTADDPAVRLVALGSVYVDFGLRRPALFDLMFRPVELDGSDAGLRRAQTDSVAALTATSAAVFPVPGDSPGSPVPTVMSWALVHGLVVLARDGALRDVGGPGAGAGAGGDEADLARAVLEAFSRLPSSAG